LEIELHYKLLIVTLLFLKINSGLFAKDNINVLEKYLLAPTEYNENTYTGLEENGLFSNSKWSFDNWSREKKVITLNVVTIGTIATIGVIGWDYGSHSFRTANEGWFDSDTPYGGADKLGHAFTTYALASVYNWLYKDWGYSDNDAILMGAANSWLTMSLIEIGDGFSISEHSRCRHGLSATPVSRCPRKSRLSVGVVSLSCRPWR